MPKTEKHECIYEQYKFNNFFTIHITMRMIGGSLLGINKTFTLLALLKCSNITTNLKSHIGILQTKLWAVHKVSGTDTPRPASHFSMGTMHNCHNQSRTAANLDSLA